MLKRIQTLPQKASKSSELVDNGEEDKPVIKRIYDITKKAPKLPGLHIPKRC